MAQPEKLYSVKYVAEILGLDRQQVYAMLKSGALPGVDVATGKGKLRRAWRVPASALAAWMKAREVEP